MGEPDAATGSRVEHATDFDRLEQRVAWIEATLCDLARYMELSAAVLRGFAYVRQFDDVDVPIAVDVPTHFFDQDADTD